MIIAALLNIALDLVFVMVFKWGVFGAALACVTGKAISVELIVSGAFSGLASTGLHQVFKQLVNGGDKSENGKDL